MKEYVTIKGEAIKLTPEEVIQVYLYLIGAENENGEKIYKRIEEKFNEMLKEHREETLKKLLVNCIFGRGDQSDE